MTPTMELQFVEREVREYVTADTCRVRKVKVLQQKWKVQDGNYPFEEWRDVPLVEEQT